MRDVVTQKKRVVVKIGSSSLTHPTGKINLHKVEQLAVELTDIKNRGLDVVLVSSGAIAVGTSALGLEAKPEKLACRQAAAAVGQAALMQIYEKFFSEYRQRIAQILLTKSIMDAVIRRRNAQNTIHELFSYNVIPIVNENDTIATDEIEVYDEFGDNDTLSALVAELVGADILILLSDIDGLYTSDPNTDPDAKLIYYVDEITPDIEKMASGAVTKVGTGGMRTKLRAAQIASDAGIDMIIANASPLDNIGKIMDGEEIGTFFKARGK